jgi:lipid-A-disaccharide synthase
VPTDVFISAGEASGDRYGAMLAQALRRRNPEVRLRGIGAAHMRAAGVELEADSSAWSAIGLLDGVRVGVRLIGELRRTQRALADRPPEVVVLIDFGAFNVRLARSARERGIPALYEMPPGAWSRQRSAGDLPEIVDAIATPFPWSAQRLSSGRARVELIGHPCLDYVRVTRAPEEAAAALAIDRQRPVVALVPGSRRHEIERVAPRIMAAAARIARELPRAQFLVPVAPTVERARVERLARAAGGAALDLRLLEGMDYDALQLADAAIATSGTATLELACLGVPMVVVYRVPWATYLQFKIGRGVRQGVRWFALPNLLADRLIVPELAQAHFSPRRAAGEALRLLRDREAAERMRRDLAEVRALLGEPGASERVAEMAMGLVSSEQ